jgi:hypothetical protein
MLHNAWFEHIWCYQEVQLARDIVVCQGSHELDWTQYGVAAICMVQFVVLEEQKGHELHSPNLSPSEAVLRFLESPTSPEDILLDMPGVGRICEATDPQKQGLWSPRPSRSPNVTNNRHQLHKVCLCGINECCHKVRRKVRSVSIGGDLWFERL